MILLLALIILPVVIFFLLKNQKNAAKSRTPPSPRGLPIIGNLHQFDSCNPHLYLSKLAEKYGPLMSMKLGKVQVLVVSSSEMAKEVLKTHDLAFCSRPPFLSMQKLTYGGLNIGFSPYNDSWREMRKICVLHLFSNKQVQSFRPIREDQVFAMIKNIAKYSNSPARQNGVNLSEITHEMVSTLICRIGFGMKTGEEDSNKRRFDDLLFQTEAIHGGFFVSDCLPLFSWVDRLSGMLSKLEKAFRDMDEFSQGLIDEHLSSNYRDKMMNPNNILDILIQIKEQKKSSVELTWDRIKAVLHDIFVAGISPTAATMIWGMTSLVKNPNVMKKLQTEIRETIGRKGFANEDDLPRLPYLQAVVKETLRLYPPGPLLIPRETLKECIIQGYTIPAKTIVHINAWAVGRDSHHWENPDQFMPERFLNASNDATSQDFRVIPFGAGRRGCPGMPTALATTELVLANLVYSFDWELQEGIKEEDIDVEAAQWLTKHKKTPLCLVPKKYICA